MIMKLRIASLTILFVCLFAGTATTYPIDGYGVTNIRRLNYMQMVVDGELKGTMPFPGMMKQSYEIQLNLWDSSFNSLVTIPSPDPDLQAGIDKLFPRFNENYSISILDITPGRPVRYASRKETIGYQPGQICCARKKCAPGSGHYTMNIRFLFLIQRRIRL